MVTCPWWPPRRPWLAVAAAAAAAVGAEKEAGWASPWKLDPRCLDDGSTFSRGTEIW